MPVIPVAGLPLFMVLPAMAASMLPPCLIICAPAPVPLDPVTAHETEASGLWCRLNSTYLLQICLILLPCVNGQSDDEA